MCFPLEMDTGVGIWRLGTIKQPVLLPQDVADFEWVMWFTSFRNVIIFTLSGHVLFAKVCSMTVPQVSGGWIKSSGLTWHLLGGHG